MHPDYMSKIKARTGKGKSIYVHVYTFLFQAKVKHIGDSFILKSLKNRKIVLLRILNTTFSNSLLLESYCMDYDSWSLVEGRKATGA